MQSRFLFLQTVAVFSTVLLSSCALQPTAWTPAPKPAFTGALSHNERLSDASKIGLLGYYGAEEFTMDKEGSIYCGVHSGKSDFSSKSQLNPR